MADETTTLKATDSLAEQAVVGLFRTTDRVRKHLSKTMEPFGITGQQYNVLRILRGAHPEPLPTLEIAERILEQTPGITRLLDRLEEKGLVARERCRKDRRQVLCSITAKGLTLLETMDEPVSTANASALAMLNAQELQDLVRLLNAIQARKGR